MLSLDLLLLLISVTSGHNLKNSLYCRFLFFSNASADSGLCLHLFFAPELCLNCLCRRKRSLKIIFSGLAQLSCLLCGLGYCVRHVSIILFRTADTFKFQFQFCKNREVCVTQSREATNVSPT